MIVYGVLLIIVLIALIIWLSWGEYHRKEHCRMENDIDIAEKERQSIDKHNEELREQRNREEERRKEQERIETDRRTAERLRKEEERRKEQRENKEHLKQVEEHQRQRERELANRQVGGGNKELENHLAKGRQLDIQANQEGRGAKQAKPYKTLEERQIDIDYRYTMDNLKHYLETVQKYEDLRKNVEQLDKVNKSLETVKDKKVKEKYETSKQSIEKKICDTLDIKKDKPKFLQSKKAVETSFRGKVQKGLADLGAKAEVAKTKIAEIKAEKNTQSSHRENEPGRTASRAKTIAPQTRTRARGR